MTLPDCTLAVLRRHRTLPDERASAALDALVVLTVPNATSNIATIAVR